MTTAKTASIKKPEASGTSRFKEGLKYANTSESPTPQAQETTSTEAKKSGSASKGKKTLVEKDEIRTNFDCPIDLKEDLDEFVKKSKRKDFKGSKKFQTNKEFIIQCIEDGLAKYSK